MRKYAPGGAVSSTGEPTKFDSAMQKTGQVTGLVGTIRSAVNQIAEPIRANAEEVDPNTGEYINQGKAERMGTFGAQLDPMRAATDTFKDKGATNKEKWAAGLNVLSPNPLASNYLAKNRYKRLEEENKRNIYKGKMQTWGGASENPYVMMPKGGQVNSETVELEQGEPYILPNGEIQSIPTNAPTHAQGGVPINLPVGTKVLGKKDAFDGKQFKQLGRRLEKVQKSYDKALDENPTGLTARTAKRMLENVQTEFNELFEVQGEDVGGQQFAEGGSISINDRDKALSVTTRPYNERTVYKQFDHPESGNPFYAAKPTIRNLSNPDVFEVSPNLYGTYKPYLEGSNKWNIDYDPSIKRTYGDVKGDVKFFDPAGYEKYSKGGRIKLRKGTNGLEIMEPRSGYIPNISEEGIQPKLTNYSSTPSSSSLEQSYNPTNTITSIGAIAPILYNVGQGMRKADTLETKDYLNPYTNEIRQSMRNRRYNINPELEQNDLESATNYRRLRDSGLEQSQFMGGMQMGSINKMRANASLLSKKQNVDSGFIADQAQMDAQLGQQAASTKLNIKDINDRNVAARRNYMAAGMSQIGQFAQIKQQENNMMVRDAQRLKLLPALVQNFTLQPDGSWVFKGTGEVMTSDQVMNYIKGGK